MSILKKRFQIWGDLTITITNYAHTAKDGSGNYDEEEEISGVLIHCRASEGGVEAPISMEDEGSVYLSNDEVPQLIEALKYFVEE